MTEQPTSVRQRAITAGLSATGAAAGAGGLALAGKEMRTGYREARAATPGIRRVAAIGRSLKSRKLATALLPLEAVGLGGELMATKILHQDVKNQQVRKGLAMESHASQVGRRIVDRPPAPPPEVPVDKGLGAIAAKVVKPAAAAAKPKPESLADIGRRARASLGNALEEKGHLFGPTSKALTHPDGNSIADMGVEGSFAGQKAAGALERAKMYRERAHQLAMEASEEESGLKRKQADRHLAMARNLERQAHGHVRGAVGVLGLNDGMSASGLKAAGEKSSGGSKSVKKADYERTQRRRNTAAGALSGGLGGVALASLDPGRRNLLGQAREFRAARESATVRAARTSGPSVHDQLSRIEALHHAGQAKTAARVARAAGHVRGGAITAAGVGLGATFGHLKDVHHKPVGKARRFDPEADRQRRLGAYAGLAGGGAIVAGSHVPRHFAVHRPFEYETPTPGGPAPHVVRGLGRGIAARPGAARLGRLRVGHGAVGTALAATSAGLAGLGAAAYRRGVSERNQPWT